MATTTNYSFTLPTVGGSSDQWGTNLNANWTSIDTLLGGTNATEFGYLGGVTSAIQTQLNAKSPIASPTFTGTATIPTAAITTANITTANITTADFGDWTITEDAGVLKFATGGVNKMSLDASGNLTVTGNVNAAGTI
tara:strand:+ start:1504 stop:1917 length:414 start_codon:yes stop_codon:yes gene_type:complete